MASLISLTLAAAAAAQLGAAWKVAGPIPAAPAFLCAHANFVRVGGGTTFDAWLQTSLDGGASWCDIANFHFTTTTARAVQTMVGQTGVLTPATPTDGSLPNNTALNGIMGTQFRVKWTSVGTYTGASTFSLDVAANIRLEKVAALS